MKRNPEILERAAELVRDEQVSIRAERDAFEQFREAVRLAKPGTSGGSNTGDELAQTYQDTVLAIDDYDATYGETLEEHLERELSPTLANALLSDDTITKRRKRNLLITTSDAIEKRTHLVSDLQTELDSITTFADDIGRVKGELQTLPDCTLQEMSLDELLDLLRRYESLEQRCERVAKERQLQFSKEPWNVASVESNHPMNAYLYSNFVTQYPVLKAVTQISKQLAEGKIDDHLRLEAGSKSVNPVDNS